jgi:uncharacterized protein YndB with AHSA1/START domain
MATNISRLVIHAPAAKVWDALTEPAWVKQWQFGSDLYTDWQVNSDIRFKTPFNGTVFEQWGKVLEVRPGRLLRYSLFAPRPGLEDKPEHYFEMRYALTEHGADTHLEITQEDNRPGAKQEGVQGEENPILKGLKDLIEKS